MKLFSFSVCILALFILAGCAAMQTSSEFKDLELTSSLDRPVFLANQSSRALFLEMDCPVIEWQGDITNRIAGGLAAKGYSLTQNRDEADIVMTIMVRQAHDMEKTSARRVQGTSAPTIGGSTVAGAGVGAVSSGGSPTSTIVGAAGGLVFGSVIDVTINNWVYLGALEIDAFIQVKETSQPNRAEIKSTETRATARARQANMKWEDASGRMEEALVKQIVMALPKK